MNKSVLWLSTLFLWISLLVAHPLSTAAVQEQSPKAVPNVKADSKDRILTMTSPTFMDAVNQWVKRISKEKGYESWSSASWTSSPLGPGTHGWIILLKANGSEVGYMVIHAADPNNPNQYHLTEYGSGSTPLFSLNTLYRSLVQLELIDSSYEAERWYTDPLHAVWIVSAGSTSYFIDAKTGEALPLTSKKQLQETVQAQASSTDSIIASTPLPQHAITFSRQVDGFDPYEHMSWLLEKPLPLSAFADLQSLLDRPQPPKLTYIAELYSGQVNMPFAVTGYQQWSNDEVFIQLEQGGRRAIPYNYARASGHVFP